MNDKHILQINKSLCIDCHKCERALPQFKCVYNGSIQISAWAYERNDVQVGIKRIIDECPQNAISINPL